MKCKEKDAVASEAASGLKLTFVTEIRKRLGFTRGVKNKDEFGLGETTSTALPCASRL